MTDTATESGNNVAARRVDPIVAIVIDASESADRTETTAGVAIRAARRAVGSHRVLVVGQAATEAWALRDGVRWLESDGTPLGGLEVAVLAADGAPLLYCSGNDAVIATGLDALVTSLGTDAVTASGTGWDVDGEPVPTPALFDWVPRPGTLIATGVVAADTERRGLVAALRDASRGGWKNLRTDAVTVARIGDTSAGARMRTDAWTAAAIVRSLGSSLVRRPWDGARNLAATAADAARALRGLAVLAAIVVAGVAIVASGTRSAWSPWAVPAVGTVIVALGVLALLERSRPGGHVTELVRSIDVSVAAIATVARRAGRQRSLPVRSGGLALLARPVTTAATVALETAITFAAVRFATSDRAHPASTWGTAAALLAGVVLLAPMLVSLGVVVRVRPRRAGSRAELEFSAAVDGRPAEVVDVSIGGLAVLATSSRHVGDRVAVLLNPGDGALPMTVVRCSPNGDEYTVGLQLDPDAPPAARVALERTWLDATQRAAVTVAAVRPAGDTSPSTVRTPGGRARWTLGGSVAVRVTTAVTLMALGAAVLPPYPASFASGQAVVLKAIQTGTVSLPDGSTSVTATITQVDTGKAFLLYGYRGSGNDPADIVVSGALTNSTTLTFARYDNNGPVVIEWSVVEFLSGVSVQRGVASVTTADVDVPIAAVDTTRTFPMVGPRTSGAAFGDDDFFQAAITSSTNLRISTISGGTNTVPWQVVTYDEASVQTGTLSFTTTDATRTATIAPVDTAKSWLTYSLTSSDLTGDQIGQALVRGEVTDPTTLTFDRSVTGTTITLRWYLVEFLDATVVQHGNAAFGSATSTVDVALTTPVEVGRSISTGGYLTFGGRSPYTSAEDPGVGWFTTDLTSPTSLRIQRAAAVAAADLGWFVVTWPTSPTVVVNSSGDAADTTPGDGVCWTGGNNSAGAPACTLRAAIEEANASATVDTIEFAIPTTDPGYAAGRGVFTIAPTSNLPALATTITIDGASQAVNVGDTNPGSLGYVGTVGTGPDGVLSTGDEPTLDGVAAPEIELSYSGQVGLIAMADDVRIAGLAVFGANRDVMIAGGSSVVVEDMVIGTRADSFTDPGAGARSTGSAGVAVFAGSNAQVRDNLIGYQTNRGVEVNGTLSSLTIAGNEITGTSQGTSVEGGGIEFVNFWNAGNAVSGVLVTGNLIHDRVDDYGIEVATDVGDAGIVIDDNTILGTSPLLVYGNPNVDGGTISHNVLRDSIGHGVYADAVADWTITENSIANSTWGGIGLSGTANDGITAPNIDGAVAGSGTVDVGYSITAPAGTYQVEFFDNAVAGTGGIGEGESYLGTDPITHPGGTATYSHTVTGAEGDIVTATLTEDLGGGDLGSTSEFSNAFTVTQGALDPVVLERIQKGTTTIADGSTTTSVTIDTVDLTSSVLMLSVRGDNASPENIVVAGYMTGPSTFVLRRSATIGLVTVDWSVLTFETGVTVQHGHTGMSSVTQQDVSIDSVDLTRTFPLVSWFAGGAGFDGGDFVGAQLTSETNLRLSAVNATSRDVYYQIVSYNDAEVQRGTVALGSAASSATAAVGPVDTTKSWLTYTMTSATGTAADIGQKLIRGRVTDATTLTFDRSSTGQAVDVQWHLVEFTDDTLVQSGSSAFGTGTTQNDVAITAVDPARSVATGGYLGYGGRSSYTANDNPGVGWFTTRLTSATNMRATRGVTGSATADLGWFVITWNGAGSDTVTVNSTDDDTDLFPGDGYCDTGGVNASGHVECTVRAAIQEANASSVVDTIHFAIPGAGPTWTISPSSALPTITAGVTIDATTQPGYGSTPVISIDGAGAPGGPGLDVSGDDVTVRGLNVRSFPGDGVSVTGARFMLEASHIGTNADGTAASPNALSGLLIAGPDATIQGNLVSGNSSNGVRVQSGGDRARIVDNHIGTTVTGNAALPNGQEGVEIDEADDVVVGEPGLGNVLSGNNYSGINGWAGDATGTVIQGNLIGVGADGSTALGNSTAVTEGGITIRGPVHDWTIGGTGPGEGNVIADNIGDGISLIDVNGVADDITILGNSIHADTGLGIDIGDDGVTANDAGDADTGINDRLNSPVISSAIVTSGTADVAYALDLPAGDYRVEFFTNPSGADPTGYGEGETFVHAETISHAGLGSAGFTASFAGSAGDVITATVTEDLGGGSFGSTSEFSAAVCTDSDGDGLWDCEEDANTDLDNDPATNPGPDTDGDSLPNYLDADDDSDGIPTADENGDPNGNGDPRDARDTDRDGQPDYLDIEAGPSSTPVADEQKISATSGGLVGPLDDSDNLGQNVTGIGDLDGDGINDLAVGVPEDDDGGPSRGAVYVLFMNADGTVRAEQKISDTAGGFTGVLTDFGEFGHGVATLGDIDGDGVTDIAVGTWTDVDGGPGRGAVWILFLERDGTVKAHRKISDTTGGLVAALDDYDRFGSSLSGLGDLDGDGTPDLAVGAREDDDGGADRGAAFILFLNTDGSVRAEQKISATAGGLTGVLDDVDEFGHAVAGIGDLDGDGIGDVAVGAPRDDDGGTDRGAVHVLFLNADGTVQAEQKLSAAAGPLAAALDDHDWFGSALAGIGDLDGNATPDLAVGARGDTDGAWNAGAVHLLRLAADGTIVGAGKISATSGGLTGPLDVFDHFGRGIGSLGDLDGDGALNLAVSARYDDDGGPDRGAVYILDLSPPPVPTVVVNSTGDAPDQTPGDGYCQSGAFNSAGDRECTLRAAIEEANASVIVDSIHFDIPASDAGHTAGVWTIQPTTALPSVAAAVVLDASSQPGWATTPVVAIDGSGIGAATDGVTFAAGSGGSEVRGLAVGGFSGHGIVIDFGSSGNLIAGNHIGTDAGGLVDAGNGSAGILVWTDGNTIGGATAADRNVISGNGGYGIFVGATTGNVFRGNHIGVDVTGNTALGNTWNGIYLGGGDGNVVDANVIGDNGDIGIRLEAGSNHVITANSIGVGADGTSDVGNLVGISARFGSTDILVGGADPSDANVVANNGHGVVVMDAGTSRVAIVGNEIRGNDDLGIDLEDDGVTPNDAGDADTGANDLLNFPDISSAVVSAGTVDVSYSLDVPAGNYRVEFFVNPSGADPTGHGEGDVFVHAETVSPAGFGPAGFTASFAGSAGDVITATVTEDLGSGEFGSTSEFSAAVFAASSTVVVNSTGDGGDAVAGDGACDTGGVNSEGDDECTLRAAIAEANANATVDTIEFDVPTSDAGHTAGVWTIQPTNGLPDITAPVTIDGTTQAGTAVNTAQAPDPMNGRLAIELSGAADSVTSDWDGLRLHVGSDGSVIRGLAFTGWDNPGSDGILVWGSSSHVIAGNFIGVDADGLGVADGVTAGVGIGGGSTGTRVGGIAAADRNLIANGTASGGGWAGVWSGGASNTGIVVEGNEIGLGVGGAAAPGGWAGIHLMDGATATIGGAVAGAANRITGHANGVIVQAGPASVSSSILGNRIWENGLEGIDLDGDGVTANDAGDTDTGPNDLLNFPVITSASDRGGLVDVTFDLDVPTGTYRIELFANPSGAGQSGYGEGEELVDVITVTHPGGGGRTYTTRIPGAAGDVLTATATEDLGGGAFGATSEFSQATTVVGAGANVRDLSERRSDLVTAGDATGPGGTGVAGTGVTFGGGYERLVGPATDLTSGAVTLSTWVQLDATSTSPRLVSKRAQSGAIYELLVDDATGAAEARFGIGGSEVTVQGGTLAVGTWHQVAATWDGSAVRLYVDGTEVAQAPASGALATDLSTPLVVGNVVGANRGLIGSLDTVQVAHTARSSAWIETAYLNQSNPAGFVSVGEAETAAAGTWSASSTVVRNGGWSLAAPAAGNGAEAWAAATGLDEPGIAFESWWYVTSPATSRIAAGTNAGATPIEQRELGATDGTVDLATRSVGGRTVDASSATVVPTGTWTRVEIRTDELGRSTAWIDGVQVIGPTPHSGGTSAGTVGLRAGAVGTGGWYVDDVRIRRYVSDEPTATLGPLHRN